MNAIVPESEALTSRPARLQLSPLGWLPPGAIDVSTGPWRNPFVVGNYVTGSDGTPLAVRIEDSAHAARLFREMVQKLSLPDAMTFAQKIKTLRGRHLACTCPLHAPCHADILIELANP